MYLNKDLDGATSILEEAVAMCKEQRATGNVDPLQASETHERLGVVYWSRGGTSLIAAKYFHRVFADNM